LIPTASLLLLLLSFACSTGQPAHRARPKASGLEDYLRLAWVDENGRIPPDGMIKALQQVQRMKAAQPSPDAAGINRQSWTWIGPGNIGGRVTAILFSPADPNVMWINNPGGGIWKSTNGGESWAPVNDFLANLAVSALAMSPTDPNLLLAGTGGGAGGSLLRGAGIFKSTDGGNSWSQVASTSAADWSGGVEKIAFSPDGKTILAATKPFYGDVPATIFRSTDNGDTWTESLGTPTLEGVSVEFHPTDSNQAIASTKNGIAVYTEDGGRTWKQAAGIPVEGLLTLAYAKSDPSIVYGGIDRNGGEIYRSTDGGKTYTQVNASTGYLGDQGWYCNVVAVDPKNPNVVLIAGLDIYRSTDGGQNFAKISQWESSPKSAHADHGTIAFPPNYDGTSNKTVYFGNDGGLYRTQDVLSVEGEAGWQDLNNNLGVTQIYGAWANPLTNVVMAGTQDNGSIRYSGDAQKWTRWQGGDGGFIATDPTDANTFYGEYVYLTIYRSNDGGIARPDDIYGSYNYFNGTSWEKRQRTNPITEAKSGTANFIAPFILDPNNPNRMLAGARSLWVTNNVKKSNDDGGPDWTAIKPPAGDTSANNISAIAVANGNSDVIWAGHTNGDVFMTTNGTAGAPAWKKVGDGVLPRRKVSRVAIDPKDANTAYVAFGGFTSNNVWKTTDGGATFSPAVGSGSNQLPQIPVETIAIHPNNSRWLYAGTEVGLFTSEDGGATWSVPQDGPANVSVKELTFSGTTLYAATFGRGVYKADIPAAQAKMALDCYTLTIDSDASKSGVLADVQPNCNHATQYTAGTVVTLRARAHPPYVFSRWSGDAAGNARTTTVTMNGNKVVRAHVIADKTCFTLSVFVIPQSGGDVTLSPPPNCDNGYAPGTEVTFRATPRSSFTFGGWFGDYFDTDPEGSIEMDDTHSITAVFAQPATNDAIANAIDLGSASKFSYTEDTSDASDAADDPDTCAAGKGGKTVWFKFTPAADGLLALDTNGGNYHTVVQVLTGSPGSLRRAQCSDQALPSTLVTDNDLVASDELAGLVMLVKNGTTYYIEVADATEPELEQRDFDLDEDVHDVPDGGLLQFHANFTAGGTIKHRAAGK